MKKIIKYNGYSAGGKKIITGLPWWPVVKNPPASAGDTGSIPGQESKVPQATRHLGLLTTVTELVLCNEKPLPEA